MSFRRAAILAVGTELTTGQTENTNSSWISRRLVDFGIEVQKHLVIADQRADILSALSFAAHEVDLLFVTGGLGPTADDFTREVVAAYVGKPTEFDASIWAQICERLTGAGIRVAESNRQQCYFPQGAEVLKNPAGTAAGFRTIRSHGEAQIVVLPGPPREVEAIWNSGLGQWVQERSPGLSRRLLTWQCLGKSEAELGEIVEAALLGSGLETGYRAHRPYVEIKVWAPVELSAPQAAQLGDLESALKTWIVQGPSEPDVAHQVILGLGRDQGLVEVLDQGLGNLLCERIAASARVLARKSENQGKLPKEWSFHGWVSAPERENTNASQGLLVSDAVWRIHVQPGSEKLSWTVVLKRHFSGAEPQTWETELVSPFRVSSGDPSLARVMEERVTKWAVEAALVWMRECLKRSGNLA